MAATAFHMSQRQRYHPSATSAVTIDATPAYHVWHGAPKNMLTFFGPEPAKRLRLVWMLRDPVSKFWSYFWELKMYGGEWNRVTFSAFLEPKLARTVHSVTLNGAVALIDQLPTHITYTWTWTWTWCVMP